MVDLDKVLLIVKRDKPVPHYEVHLEYKVEFITLDGKYLGESEVEEVN